MNETHRHRKKYVFRRQPVLFCKTFFVRVYGASVYLLVECPPSDYFMVYAYWAVPCYCDIGIILCVSFSGHYMYIEASGKSKGNNARLLSPKYRGMTSHCVEFYYHMHGRHAGTLTVLSKVQGVLLKLLDSTTYSGNSYATRI